MWRYFYLVFIAVSFGAYLWWDGGDEFRSHDFEREFRNQFHLPADMKFAMSPRKAGGREPCHGVGIVRAEVRLTPAEFARFEASLSEPAVWKPTALNHFSPDLGDYRFAEDALQWRPVRHPQWAGEKSNPFALAADRPRFYHSDSEFAETRHGQFVCYAISANRESLFDTPDRRGYADIAVTSCDAALLTERPDSYALAVLDSDNRRLRMKIEFAHPPQYCEAARRRPLYAR